MKRTAKIFLLGVLFPFYLKAQGFKTVGSELHDANGNNFIMKGMNVPLAWFVNDVNSNIASLRTNTNVNTLRIVVQTTTAANAWQTCVQNCINNKIIPMVELHDVTGSTNTADLLRMAQFWADNATFLKRPEIAKYILINIANEWSTWQYANPTTNPAWKDTYNACVKIIRDAGIKTTLVIDAPGYGQDGSGRAILNNGISMINADPEKNLLFSIHMYCEWKVGGNSSITKDLPAIKTAGIPIIVGEFGYQHDENGGTCDIDESLILSTCQNNGIGWLAWSLTGNGSPVQYLDLSSDFSGKSLSSWGNTIVNGANGTKTAVTASVFTVTGLNNREEMEGLTISPNPAMDQVHVAAPAWSENATYQIYNSAGLEVSKGKVGSSEFDLDLSGFTSGLYVLQMVSDGQIFSKKVMKK